MGLLQEITSEVNQLAKELEKEIRDYANAYPDYHSDINALKQGLALFKAEKYVDAYNLFNNQDTIVHEVVPNKMWGFLQQQYNNIRDRKKYETQAGELEKELEKAVKDYANKWPDYERDIKGLNKGLELFKQMKYKEAQGAFDSLDTIVRDHIPGNVWNFLEKITRNS